MPNHSQIEQTSCNNGKEESVKALKNFLSIPSKISESANSSQEVCKPPKKNSTKSRTKKSDVKDDNINNNKNKSKSSRKSSPPLPNSKVTNSSPSCSPGSNNQLPSSTKSAKKSTNKSSKKSSAGNKTPSPPQTFFASSAFLNSPDPYSLPMPDFDLDDDDSTLPPSISSEMSESLFSSSTSDSPPLVTGPSGENSKTLLLRNVLNVKSS